MQKFPFYPCLLLFPSSPQQPPSTPHILSPAGEVAVAVVRDRPRSHGSYPAGESRLTTQLKVAIEITAEIVIQIAAFLGEENREGRNATPSCRDDLQSQYCRVSTSRSVRRCRNSPESRRKLPENLGLLSSFPSAPDLRHPHCGFSGGRRSLCLLRPKVFGYGFWGLIFNFQKNLGLITN